MDKDPMDKKFALKGMLDKLNDVQLDKLIAIWKPEKDAETGEYILGFESLSEEDRSRFRKIVEDLIAEEPKAEAPTNTEAAAQPKPEEQPKPETRADQVPPAAQPAPQESQQPAPPPMSQEEEEKQKSEAAVEEMLREFDSWI
ncbi:hypothetical protein AK812_SmicGene7364 [Symbiodinium microadriaticum]|uniref:Uncharacterized protein n=1 Tax=Symbiodinium microadriaticum TaxID=2951 RepID=A0A1Q9ENX2_SYMMI|nr:hypothetical protein AK812_SmicGene7364 [Symbiodinium microadriaticum]